MSNERLQKIVNNLSGLLAGGKLNPGAVLKEIDDLIDELNFIDEVIEFRRNRRAAVMRLHNKGLSPEEIVAETGYKLSRVKKVIRNNSPAHRGQG